MPPLGLEDGTGFRRTGTDPPGLIPALGAKGVLNVGIGALSAGTVVLLLLAKGSRGLESILVVPVAKAAGLPMEFGACMAGKGPATGPVGEAAGASPVGATPAAGAMAGGLPMSGSTPAGALMGHPVPPDVFLHPVPTKIIPAKRGIHSQRLKCFVFVSECFIETPPLSFGKLGNMRRPGRLSLRRSCQKATIS